MIDLDYLIKLLELSRQNTVALAQFAGIEKPSSPHYQFDIPLVELISCIAQGGASGSLINVHNSGGESLFANFRSKQTRDLLTLSADID